MHLPEQTAPKVASRRQLLLFTLASCLAASPAFARGPGGSFVSIDRNRDGSLDLDEAKRAAELTFQRLDRRHKGVLTHWQLGRLRVSAKDFGWADRDHDGTVDKDEYLALVERQFKAADANHDGKVSSAEFKARTGLPLRRLLY